MTHKPLRIITSCTDKKLRVSHAVPARDLYLGEQHVRLMRGVRAAESQGRQIDLWIVSAGVGLIHGSYMQSPYDTTFAGQPAAKIKEQGRLLGIPSTLAGLLAEEVDTYLLLGRDYLRACDLQSQSAPLARVTAICSTGSAPAFGKTPWIATATYTPTALRELGCGHIAAKGEVMARLLEAGHERLSV